MPTPVEERGVGWFTVQEALAKSKQALDSLASDPGRKVIRSCSIVDIVLCPWEHKGGFYSCTIALTQQNENKRFMLDMFLACVCCSCAV
jgi:hypothetical protein